MEQQYQHGLGGYFESEAVANTLPIGHNSPQKAPHGLYAEQLNGSAFTAPRNKNLRSWLYRIQPSVVHGEFRPFHSISLRSDPYNESGTPPTQMRWDPLPIPDKPTDFVAGLVTFAGNGSASNLSGAAIHHYALNDSMQDRYFYNADGEFLIVPELGRLELRTEFGNLALQPGEIAVIPRGIKYQVLLTDKQARGYICENFAEPFHLPELGPIGANGLANPRDFQSPVAHYEEQQGNFELICKFQGRLWSCDLNHSPLDVVAWHGNYVPYKYDLARFNTINTVSYDHPDPSIFTVLTSQTNTPGVANVDFVIFPPRWMVAQDTFRPPYYHRNIMSEYMGLIRGAYDAKETGFIPGSSSLHNCMSAHGPDANAFEKATNDELKPEYYDNVLAIMFESNRVWQPTDFALSSELRQQDYLDCWQGLKKLFKG